MGRHFAFLNTDTVVAVKAWASSGAAVVWTTASEGHLGTSWSGRPDVWTELRQVHGNAVVRIDHLGGSQLCEADASVTESRQVTLGIKTADCGSIAIAGSKAVAAIHAGWLGVAKAIIPAAVQELRTLDEGHLKAALGPCIHSCCYEFGSEELQRVSEAVGSDVSALSAGGQQSLDLPLAIRTQLEGCGVEAAYIDSDCTGCSPGYFSHRMTGTKDRQVMFVRRA